MIRCLKRQQARAVVKRIWARRYREIIARRYDALGEEKVEPLFGDPHTHTSRAGAELNAECVVAGIKALSHDPVDAYFSAKGKAIAPYVE